MTLEALLGPDFEEIGKSGRPDAGCRMPDAAAFVRMTDACSQKGSVSWCRRPGGSEAGGYELARGTRARSASAWISSATCGHTSRGRSCPTPGRITSRAP